MWVHYEVSHLSDVHKLSVFVRHGPGLLRVVAQSDVGLQQGVQQLAKPLYCLNTHTHTHTVISSISVVVVRVVGVIVSYL